MFPHDAARRVALLLVPLLVAFAIQGSLEVLHPIEEARTEGHEHQSDGPTLGNAAECGVGAVHPPHNCPHSNALARLDKAPFHDDSAAARSRVIRPTADPAVPASIAVLGRGPPVPGAPVSN